MERTIKDPTFNIYKDGGNVETKGKELKKEEAEEMIEKLKTVGAECRMVWTIFKNSPVEI